MKKEEREIAQEVAALAQKIVIKIHKSHDLNRETKAEYLRHFANILLEEAYRE